MKRSASRDISTCKNLKRRRSKDIAEHQRIKDGIGKHLGLEGHKLCESP